MPDPTGTGTCGTAATLRGTDADAPRKRRCFHRSPRPSALLPDFGRLVGICRGRNSELVRMLRPAFLLTVRSCENFQGEEWRMTPMAIETPKTGIDAVGDMVSWG